jgi:hypothetical protein
MKNPREILKEGLAKVLPEKIVEDLLESYNELLAEYRKGNWKYVLLHAGRFVENTFRALHFLVTREEVKEVESIQKEIDMLSQTPKEKTPETIRVIIPRIAYSVYSLRSKRDSVHVKPIPSGYIDSTYVLAAASWILAEFLRLYHTLEEKEIVEIINSLVSRKVPFIEKHGEETFVTKRLGCKEEILLLLLNNPEGMTRNQIGKILGRFYSSPRITNSLDELEKNKEGSLVVYSEGSKKYYITGLGERYITQVLSRSVENE